MDFWWRRKYGWEELKAANCRGGGIRDLRSRRNGRININCSTPNHNKRGAFLPFLIDNLSPITTALLPIYALAT
ncbi:unnamed protein product [Linum trigynum]|uniref:Uncharacterized protein n=1 Tax=Linum trigynum TaxID=586398 RepID=A0AAV2DD95_9ROSI